MHLIQVDDIRAQSPQRVLELPTKARWMRVPIGRAILPGESRLGRDMDTFAQTARGVRLTDELLGASEAVYGRGVDEGDASFYRPANGGDRCGFTGTAPLPPADRPRAEADA